MGSRIRPSNPDNMHWLLLIPLVQMPRKDGSMYARTTRKTSDWEHIDRPREVHPGYEINNRANAITAELSRI